LKGSSKAIMNEEDGVCLIKTSLKDCLMETTLPKSLPWERTIVESLGHLDSNDGNQECGEICEIVVWFNHLCEMVNYCKNTT